MELHKIDDTEYYYNILSNEDGTLHVCMERTIMASVRIVIHPNDKTSIWGNFCAGKSISAVMEMYAIFGEWVRQTDDIEEIYNTCHHLHSLEKTRPWGKDPTFQKAVRDLVPLPDITFDIK